VRKPELRRLYYSPPVSIHEAGFFVYRAIAGKFPRDANRHRITPCVTAANYFRKSF